MALFLMDVIKSPPNYFYFLLIHKYDEFSNTYLSELML